MIILVRERCMRWTRPVLIKFAKIRQARLALWIDCGGLFCYEVLCDPFDQSHQQIVT